MKKILSALTAAALLCGMTAMPVSAEETEYRMGDVNMDGKIGADDAQLVLVDYLECVVVFAPERRVLTEEQVALGNVDLHSYSRETVTLNGKYLYVESDLTCADAYLILAYYTAGLAEPAVQNQDIVEWIDQNYPGYY